MKKKEGIVNSEEVAIHNYLFPLHYSLFPRRRPVGQVVKTVASHAINIGSNPVRVTSKRHLRKQVPFAVK